MNKQYKPSDVFDLQSDNMSEFKAVLGARYIAGYMARCPSNEIAATWSKRAADKCKVQPQSKITRSDNQGSDMRQLVGVQEVIEQLNCSESKLSKMVADGEFPAAANVAGKRVWQQSQVTAYIEAAALAAESVTQNIRRGQGMSVIPSSVPLKSKIHRPLQAFDDPNDAYLAGCYLGAALYGNAFCEKEARRYGIQVSATMTAGQYVVPIELQRAIVNVRERVGIFPQFANLVPMTSDLQVIPRLLGGVVANWETEAAEIDASDENLGAGMMRTHKITALAKASTELDEDSIVDLGDTLTVAMGFAMADKIDRAAFNGDATSEFGHITGLAGALDSSAVAIAAAGNVSAVSLDLTDFESAMELCGDYEGSQNCWFMHPAVFARSATRLLQGNVMQTTLPNGRVVPSFLGYPVVFVSAMPKTTSSLPSTKLAYFGDLRLAATYGVRRGARTEISRHRYFEKDLIGIKTTERLAIVIHETGLDGGPRPIVALQTAAA